MQRIWNKSFAKSVDDLYCRGNAEAEWELMSRAAKAVADQVAKLSSGSADAVGILCLVGSGNNGGDAALALTSPSLHSIPTRVICFDHDDSKISSSCKKALLLLKNLRPQVDIIPYGKNAITDFARDYSDIIAIDGIYGIGFRAPARSHAFLEARREILALTHKTVVAVDLPSGLEADCFDYDGETNYLPADYSLTFGGAKPVHSFSPGRDLCGEVVVADIGFSRAAREGAQSLEKFNIQKVSCEDFVINPCGNLPPSAHKFDRGHILVIGGSAGKLGAPIMTGLAALRSGAGWVSVALPEDCSNYSEQIPLELTFEPLFFGGKIDLKILGEFVISRRVSSIVIGPGTMQSPITDEVLDLLIQFSKNGIHVVIDAGALQGLLPRIRSRLEKPEASHFTLTPHPGEWLKMGLAGLKTYQDLRAAAHELNEMQVSVVYKSATPTVFSSGKATVSNFLNNQFAKAGAGDTLAGMIAALARVVADPHLRIHSALFQLKLAFDMVCKTRQPDSILPTDLIQSLGLIYKQGNGE